MNYWGQRHTHMVHHDSGNNHSASFLSPVFRCPCDVTKELPFIHAHKIEMLGHSKQVAQMLAIKFLDSPLNVPTVVGLQPILLGPTSFVFKVMNYNNPLTLIKSLFCVLHKVCGLSCKHWPHYC